MTTALTAYLTSTASASTLTTANVLYSTSGSPATTNKNSLINKVTGWGEVWSQGNSSVWAGAGSEPAPSGHGWILDSTVLEGQQFAAANWSGTITVKMNSAITASVTFHLRAYKRSSSGVYTNIVDIAASSASLSSSNTTVTFSATAGSAMSFSTGDKLYIDVVGNITVAPFSSGFSIEIIDLSTDTSGLTGSTAAEMVTPGYTSSGGGVPALSQQIIYSIPAMTGGNFV
jgi:hypothetical protein